MGTTRRTFLSVSVVVTAGGALQLLLACKPRGGGTTVVEGLTAQFRDLASVERVGSEALRKLGGDADVQVLLDRVAPERGMPALRAEIREQHARGDTLDLEGWRLSRTEAEIYALVALARRAEATDPE